MENTNYQCGDSFFFDYPEVLSLCKTSLYQIRKTVLRNEEELNFDIILPFLLPINDENAQLKMSYELAVYREVIDNYNHGKEAKLLSSLFQKSASYYPISLEDYSYFNSKREIVGDDLIKSYEFSTDRVFYRYSILLQYKNYFKSTNDFVFVMNELKKISSFLLFDDDLCDLEEDIRNKKDTLLVSFLEFHENVIIKDVIDMFINYMENIKVEKLYKFIRPILNIYK